MIALPEAFLPFILALCRIGGCFLVLPGLSGSRIPPQVRLFLVIGIVIALFTQVSAQFEGVRLDDPMLMARYMASETLIGLFIGFCVRYFLLALGFMGNAIGMSIGYGNLMGPGIEEVDPQAAVSTLLTMSAILLLFMMDFHHAVIRSLIASYSVMPVDGTFSTGVILMNLTETLQESFMIVLRLGSPFIAYALVINLMVGILNKLTPQIPIYFVSLPFVIAGGLVLLYFALPTFLSLFVQGFFDLRVIR